MISACESKRAHRALGIAGALIATGFALAIGFGVVIRSGLLDRIYDTSWYYPVHSSGAVLITGTHSGLGLLATQVLASHGYDVLATVRKPEELEMWEGTAHVHPILLEDVGDLASVESSIAAVKDWLADTHDGPRHLVGVVNNAGGGISLPLDDSGYTPDNFRRTFEINVFGPMYVTKAALPLMSAGGRIVNIGSLSRSCSPQASDPYSASKHALYGMSTSWRRELLDAEISVSYVEPGWFDSKMGGSQGAVNGAPHETARAILHAVQSAYPQTRYFTESSDGLPAWWWAFNCRTMPARYLDGMLRTPSKSYHLGSPTVTGTLSLSKAAFAYDEELVATFTLANASGVEWLGVYHVGACTASTCAYGGVPLWLYACGDQSCGLSRGPTTSAGGTLAIGAGARTVRAGEAASDADEWPLPAGSYELVLLAAGSAPFRIIDSVGFTVATSVLESSVPEAVVSPGSAVA